MRQTTLQGSACVARHIIDKQFEPSCVESCLLCLCPHSTLLSRL